MGKIKSELKMFLDKLYHREAGRILIAFVITFGFFIIVYIKTPIVFFINDDENIMYTLAGYYTNGETMDHSFVNFLLGAFIRGLYQLIPSVPWYGIFHVFILFTSILLIGKAILKEANRRKISLFFALCICSSVPVLLYVYPIVLMQFTTTSAMAGVAAIVLLLTLDQDQDSRRVRLIDCVLCVMMLLLCYMHRKNTGNIIICYFLLIGVYRILEYALKAKKSHIKKEYMVKQKRLIGLVLCACTLILIVSFVSQNIFRETPQWNKFYKYDEARYKMTDYPHDSIYKNPDLYKSLDWSEELYTLAGTYYWFFMDDRINVESFNAISETGYNNKMPIDIGIMIERAYNLFVNEYVAIVSAILAGVLFLLLVLYCLIPKQKQWLICLTGVCTVGGACLMCIYLCWKGRFILRAFQVISIPAVLILLILLIRVIKIAENTHTRRAMLIKAAIVVILGSTILAVGVNEFWKAGYEAASRVEKSEYTIKVEEYAIDNPENMYIYDTSLTFRYLPFVNYNDKYPTNLMFWGGMGWKSPAFYKQLSMNELQTSNSDILLKDNVYYVTNNRYITQGDMSMKSLLYMYMIREYGEIVMDEVDWITEDVVVYKIKRR